MKTNDAGIALIKRFEGMRLRPYKDSVGVLTVGYGHTRMVREAVTYTLEEVEDLLKQDLEYFERSLTNMVQNCTSNQFSAMVCLAFNIGTGNFANSTVRRLHNERNHQGAADAFLMWNKAGGKSLVGLSRRREAERELYLRTAT